MLKARHGVLGGLPGKVPATQPHGGRSGCSLPFCTLQPDARTL